MRLDLPIAGPTLQSRSPNVNDQRCVNWYRNSEGEGAKKAYTLQPTPGLKFMADTGYNNCRSDGILFMRNVYIVYGNKLLKIDSNFQVTVIGTLLTTTGRVVMACTDIELMGVDGTYGFWYDGTTFYDDVATKCTGATNGFSGTFAVAPTHIAVLGFYFIVNATNSGQMNRSSQRNGKVWAALTYFTAESRPDFVQAVISTQRELWLLGEQTTEIYYDAGTTSFTFTRLPGGMMDWGIQARYSVAEAGGNIFWLSQSAQGANQVMTNKGMQAEIISTLDLEYQLSQMSTTSDAYGFTYQQAGHTFYVLNFPTGGKTYVYDISTGWWAERKGYDLGRHRAGGHVYFNGKHLVGDYSNSNLYEWDQHTYTDNLEPIERIRRFPILAKNGSTLIHNSLIVDLAPGIGLTSGAVTAVTGSAYTYTAGVISGITFTSPYVIADVLVGDMLTDDSDFGIVEVLAVGSSTLTTSTSSLGMGGGAFTIKRKSEPKAMLKWSDDGHTWGNEIWTSIGAMGAYLTEIRFDMLGDSKARTYELTITDPVEAIVIGAYGDVSQAQDGY